MIITATQARRFAILRTKFNVTGRPGHEIITNEELEELKAIYDSINSVGNLPYAIPGLVSDAVQRYVGMESESIDRMIQARKD